MPPKTVNTLFFDLGGVLINFSHEAMCRNLADLCALDVPLIKDHLFEKDLGEMYERGVIDSQTLYEHFSHLSSRTFSFEALMDAASDIFSPKEEMIPLIDSLKKQKYPLYLLSNTCEAHIEFAKKRFPFFALFDGLVLSYEIGARKPEKEIFEAALAYANAEASKSFFIDDVKEHTDAAKKYGIDSHHFIDRDHLIVALAKRGIHA